MAGYLITGEAQMAYIFSILVVYKKIKSTIWCAIFNESSPVMDRVCVRLMKLLWSVQGQGKFRIRVWVWCCNSTLPIH